MSPTDRRTATRRPAGTDEERSAADGRSAEPSGPIDIPEIVPATLDVPDPSSRAVEPDVTDNWVESQPAPVVVGTPTGASAPLRVRGRRPRVRKVTRVVRHLDPWSTFKVAALFSLVLYGVLLTSGVLLWNVAANTGTVSNVERWFTQFGWESFELDGGEIFRNAWVAGLFGAVALTGAAVLVATLFNLVSDMVGGVRLTVLEEEVVERTAGPSRRYVVRRPSAGFDQSARRNDRFAATDSAVADPADLAPDRSREHGAHDPVDATLDDRPWRTAEPRGAIRGGPASTTRRPTSG